MGAYDCGKTFHDVWEVVSPNNRNKKDVYVQSLITGYVRKVNTSNLRAGNVKDPYTPSVCGIGYLGNGLYSPKSHKSRHILWQSIIVRAYGNTPGYEGTTVCERWHNFQEFAEDIEALPGFDLWSTVKSICLDKDLIDKGKKLYSPETCQFVTNKENNQPGARTRPAKYLKR